MNILGLILHRPKIRSSEPSNTFSSQLLYHLLAYGVPAILSVVSSVIFTRMFTPDEYGEYSVVISFITLASSFIEQWLLQAVMRMLPGAGSGEVPIILRAVNIGLVIMSTTILILSLVLSVFNLVPYSASSYIWAASVMLWTQILVDISSVILRARLQAALYSRFQIVISILKFCLSLVLGIWVFQSPVGLVWGTGIGALIGVFPLLLHSGLWGCIFQTERLSHSVTNNLFSMFRYGFPMMGWFLAINILSTSDRILIGWINGSTEVGIYSANYNLITGAVLLITAPIQNAANPYIMNVWSKNDVEKTKKILGTTASLIISTGILLTGGTILTQHDIAYILLGHSFSSGSNVMGSVVAGGVAMAFANYAHKPFEFIKNTKLMMYLAVLAAFLNVLLNIYLLPLFGYIAAAWTTFICYFLYALLTVIFGQRIFSWKLPLRMPIVCIVLCTIAVIITKLVYHIISPKYVIFHILLEGTLYLIFTLIPILLMLRRKKFLNTDLGSLKYQI